MRQTRRVELRILTFSRAGAPMCAVTDGERGAGLPHHPHHPYDGARTAPDSHERPAPCQMGPTKRRREMARAGAGTAHSHYPQKNEPNNLTPNIQPTILQPVIHLQPNHLSISCSYSLLSTVCHLRPLRSASPCPVPALARPSPCPSTPRAIRYHQPAAPAHTPCPSPLALDPSIPAALPRTRCAHAATRPPIPLRPAYESPTLAPVSSLSVRRAHAQSAPALCRSPLRLNLCHSRSQDRPLGVGATGLTPRYPYFVRMRNASHMHDNGVRMNVGRGPPE